jgi:alpha-L-fucosidase
MKRTGYINLIVLSILMIGIILPLCAQDVNEGPFTADLKSFKQQICPDWFRDAKFGIWSHWGPASVPGIGNEYPKDMYKQGSKSYIWHVSHYGHPSKVGYKDVILSWKAEKFEPEKLMEKYKAAGAKYFVALATHHDNFDNFESSNPWNSLKQGPKKDIVGLWRTAALNNGLRFGVSSHADGRGWNYYVNSFGSDATGPMAGVPYDGQNPKNWPLYNKMHNDPKENPSKEWLDLWYIRHIELIDKYQPDLLYFDGGIPFDPYGTKVVAHFLNANARLHGGKAEAVVNLKNDDMVRDYERGVAISITEKPWQDDTSLGGWFFLVDSVADYHSRSKSAATVIHTLIDIVSKNGNLLLNMPQRGDGSLYPECENVLAELAEWMPINGEAIFGTRPWKTFGEGPSKFPRAMYMNELKQPLTSEDFRFTTKGDVLYAFCLGVPPKEVRIESLGRLGSRIASVELLGSNEKLKWKQEWEGLIIQPVTQWPCKHAITYKIHFAK